MSPIKIGSIVTHETADPRGFITRVKGRVTWIDKSLATPSGCCIVDVLSAHVYHPLNPTEGRDVPASGKSCFNLDECAEEPNPTKTAERVDP